MDVSRGVLHCCRQEMLQDAPIPRGGGFCGEEGAGGDWIETGWIADPRVQHPQSLLQRSIPWGQLQEVFSMIATSWAGGR
jgi:hypothetical protein